MRLKIIKKSGDSRTWVARTTLGFNARQRGEIEAFRTQAHAEPGPEAVVTEHGDTAPPSSTPTLPDVAESYLNTVEANEDERALIRRKIDGLNEELDAVCREIHGLRLRATLDKVMTAVEDDSKRTLTVRELIAIREEIVRQLD